MGVHGSGPNHSRVLQARWVELVFPTSSLRPLRHTFLWTFLRLRRPLVAAGLMPSRRPEPCRPRPLPRGPRRHGPSCSPGRPSRAYAAYGRACAPATTLQVRPVARPGTVDGGEDPRLFG